jgi:adenine-specific DNA-methyltransferase
LPKKKLTLATTTLWDYASQSYSDKEYGNKNYPGVTPAHIIWQLLRRYTKRKDLVVDPMAGSGTTLDVARELKRRALGYDLQPQRRDIFRVDARKLPLDDSKADFVFIDPPYSQHITYSGLPACLGELSGTDDEYYAAMQTVIGEIARILRPDRYMALFIADSFAARHGFIPIAFRVFHLLEKHFLPIDIVAVKRYNGKLLRNNWHTAAIDNNYFLRGFTYLFIMYKQGKTGEVRQRRDAEDVESDLADRRIPQNDSVNGKSRKRRPTR